MPPRTPNPPPDGAEAPAMGITMLGASETGKTTFLASLQIALLRQDHLGWSLTGDNPGSTQAMIKFMNDMTRLHTFPPPNLERLENYRWSLTAQVPGVREWRRWRFRRRTRSVSIPLDLVDGPGGAADGTRIFGRALAENLIASLAGSSGIMLFFDPLSEYERGDAFQHLYGVLTLLRSQAENQGRKLPHHVAVCITKFDAIPVFRSALALRVLARNPEDQQFPYVPEEYAQEFFSHLIKMSRSDDASLILPLLRQTFHEDRIRFFVTSAIGFYVDSPIGMFDPDDYQNHVAGKPDRIRGGVYPINVVESILWLGRIVAKAAG
jgi:hypothetical protein